MPHACPDVLRSPSAGKTRILPVCLSDWQTRYPLSPPPLSNPHVWLVVLSLSIIQSPAVTEWLQVLSSDHFPLVDSGYCRLSCCSSSFLLDSFSPSCFCFFLLLVLFSFLCSVLSFLFFSFLLSLFLYLFSSQFLPSSLCSFFSFFLLWFLSLLTSFNSFLLSSFLPSLHHFIFFFHSFLLALFSASFSFLSRTDCYYTFLWLYFHLHFLFFQHVLFFLRFIPRSFSPSSLLSALSPSQHAALTWVWST